MATHKVLQHPQYLAHSFRRLHPGNFTPGRGGNEVTCIVIHLMDGSYEGSISWGQNDASNVSWHYSVARSGLTSQNVSEHNTTWSNSSWFYNQRAVTIETEGRVSDGGPTDAQLHAVAKLAAGISHRHNVPLDRQHIFGHTEIPGVTKPCPGNWPWERFMRLVKAYRRNSASKTKPAGAGKKAVEPVVLKYGIGRDGNPNSSYISAHPTHYQWTDPLEELTARIVNMPEFRGKIWITTYRDHPPGSRKNHPPYGRDMDSLDVWGYGGRGDPLPVDVGARVFEVLFRDPNPPDIDWIIYRNRIWARTYGWRKAPAGPVGSDPRHDWHIHATSNRG